MNWLIPGIASRIFYGISNIFDNYLSNKHFKNPFVLLLYILALEVVMLPGIWVFAKPSFPGWHTMALFLLIGLLEVTYLYFYLLALKENDTSIVISLFSLGKIFVPIISFFILGEVLTFRQYVGFVVLVLASVALSFRFGEKFKLNRSFWLVSLSSLIVSIVVSVYKYALNEAGWSTSFTFVTTSSFVIALFFVCMTKSGRSELKTNLSMPGKVLIALLLTVVASFGAEAAYSYALSLSKTSLVTSLTPIQSLSILIFALLLNKKYPEVFTEEIDKHNVFKKIFFYFLTFIGLILVIK
jgi:drug/metabolite transporter (DMT)-like permease